MSSKTLEIGEGISEYKVTLSLKVVITRNYFIHFGLQTPLSFFPD